MTDRELLEKAAKALGTELLLMGEHWNPLEDDGDALRLAVTLGLIVETGRCWLDKRGPMYGEDVLPCSYAATRRAIVRAAAAIGGRK